MIALLLITQKPCAKPFGIDKKIPFLSFRLIQNDLPKVFDFFLRSTQTSKMIEQKKRDLPPVNFESNEDSLDGFDLAEFDPR